MSASITEVINVSIQEGGQLAARDNFNIVTIITGEKIGGLSSTNRFSIHRDSASVAAQYGTYSKPYEFSKAFFGTSPNPVNAGGYLVIAYWRSAEEAVAATAAVLTGAQLSEVATIGVLQAIQDGSFDVDVDGSTQNVTGVDFRAVTTLVQVVGLLNDELTGATASINDQKIVITSDTTGTSSALTFLTAPAGGTFIGDILTLSEGSGSTLAQGAASTTIALQSKEAAVTEIKALTNFKGGMFIDNPTDVESKSLAQWAQANGVLLYDVFNAPANLEVSATNVVWDIKLSSLTNYRMLFSKANNRKMAAAYMARAHTVNFNAINSALTMQLKEIPIAAEDYSSTEILKAKTVGLDIYTTIKLTPVLLTSGANDFTDNRYNLLAYVDAIATGQYNLLKLTASKVPQTQPGVNKLVDQAEKDTRGFVTAGFIGPGTWSSPDTFGDVETFKRSISQNGFYWLANSLSEQPQSDRELRKSPVLQGAIKFQGAIHSVDLIIVVNK